MTLARKETILCSLTLMVIIICGIFLRLYHLSEVYTEYDDVGVVALHKSLSSEHRDIKLYDDSILRIDVEVASRGLKEELLDSPWYPVYMGYTWTYPLGQYLLYPFFIDEADSYESKRFKSRLFSALTSSLTLLLLLYLLYELNHRRIDMSVVVPMAVLAFSFNSILYAHHASPYSITVTCFTLSLIVFLAYYRQNIGITRFFILHGILLVFNYLILLLMPLYGLVIVVHKRWVNPVQIVRYFYKGALAFLILFLPISILFFKPSKGLHGVTPPSDLFSLEYWLYFPTQFLTAISSSVQGLFISEVLTLTFVGVSLLFVGYRSFKRNNDQTPFDRLLLLLLVLLMVEWMILHAMGKLIMDETRHLLMWAVPICLILFYAIRSFDLKAKFWLVPLGVLILYGTYSGMELIKSKHNQFDFDQIKAHPSPIVLTYGFTLSALLAFDHKQVYNVDVQSFTHESLNHAWPKQMLLVSQSERIETYLTHSQLNPFFNTLMQYYAIKPLTLLESKIYFPYNNYPISSNPNGFFLYEMTYKGVQ